MPGKLLALGDSITYGAWDPAGGWVARLRANAHRSLDDVRAYEAVMAEVAAERGLPHVPLCEGMTRDMLDEDGVHPNGPGHAYMAERIWAAVSA